MPSGANDNPQVDPLTGWELAALNVLIALHPEQDLDVKASRANMLALMQSLDRGDLDPMLADAAFMRKTERLLLALLRGQRIEVTDPSTYQARKEIFAAAQVVYNQAVTRGMWPLHPEIREAIKGHP